MFEYDPPGTELSIALCKHIAERSDGTCILGFSRGKDSVAAWIWLRKFFKRIIPFHACVVPGLTFVEESLDYYERIFETKIERLWDGELSKALGYMWFQPIEREPLIEELEFWDYGNNDLVDFLRVKYDVPKAYGAFAMSIYDSMFRRAIIKRETAEGTASYEGAIRTNTHSFYPCFDWTVDMIITTVEKSGVWLPDDYKIACRTVAGMPHNRNLDRLINEFPEDFKKIERIFPLLKSQWARNEFRKMRSKASHKYYPLGPKTVSDVLEALPKEMQYAGVKKKSSGKKAAKKKGKR